MRLSLVVLLALGLSRLGASAGHVITNASELLSVCADPGNTNLEFDVQGLVSYYTHTPPLGNWHINALCDGIDLSFYEFDMHPPAISPHDFKLLDSVRIQGRTYRYDGKAQLGYTRVDRQARHWPMPVPTISPHEMFDKTNLHAVVSLKGTIRDVSRDESDPRYVLLTLICANEICYVMLSDPEQSVAETSRFVGCPAVVSGVVINPKRSLRRYGGRILVACDTENIQVETPSRANPHDIPDLLSLRNAQPLSLKALDRHKVAGTILATWHSDLAILKTDDGEIVNLQFLRPPSPPISSHIQAVGFPQADFYFLQLRNATWNLTGSPPSTVEGTGVIEPACLFSGIAGSPAVPIQAHGKVIRFIGVVRHIATTLKNETRIAVEYQGRLIPVDVSSHPEATAKITVGCTISATGVCIIDSELDFHGTGKSRPVGMFVVPRTPSDIVVIARPSWWTSTRLLGLLGLFAAALVGVIGWNVSLNRRARAKGKELAAEQLAHVTSELKVSERTRLAVELHDALSQTLTGVSMQIDTAAGLSEGKSPAVTRCLSLASRTIDACRMELRNTLWDLRSAALDEPSMDAAIRKTLCQNLAGIELSVRFNVPRETFTDNTAHTVLKIVRELAANALRHGHATSLKIAGAVEGDRLLFSVKDNGCGFDPDLAPGIGEGHFGLQGITERLERLNGEMKIDSSPCKGTKVTISLFIPRSGE